MIITGNPGVGKHTIAKEILKHLKLSLLDINSIARDLGLFEQSENINDVDVDKLEKVFNEKTLDSNLIVGHLAPYVISPEKVCLPLAKSSNFISSNSLLCNRAGPVNSHLLSVSGENGLLVRVR